MSWDDFGDFGGGGDFGSYDAFSGGSYSPQDYAGFSLGGGYQPQQQQPFSLGAGSGGLDTSFLSQFQQPQGAMSPMGMPQGGGQFSLPPAQPQQPGAPQQGGAGGLMSALPGLLGAGGGLAGIIGQLVGGGQGAATTPKMGTAQVAQMNQANQAMQPGATGQLPLQQMQMSLLQALQSGQGLPPGYQQLIEQAFQPQMGDLYTQAAQMGQARGFHDAPAISPPGGAILGPGLANLQGQMAQAKLGLMQSLPQTFNQPIATQVGAAGQQGAGLLNAARLGTGQQVSAPMDYTRLGNSIGGLLQGAGQAMNMGSSARISVSGT